MYFSTIDERLRRRYFEDDLNDKEMYLYRIAESIFFEYQFLTPFFGENDINNSPSPLLKNILINILSIGAKKDKYAILDQFENSMNLMFRVHHRTDPWGSPLRNIIRIVAFLENNDTYLETFEVIAIRKIRLIYKKEIKIKEEQFIEGMAHKVPKKAKKKLEKKIKEQRQAFFEKHKKEISRKIDQRVQQLIHEYEANLPRAERTKAPTTRVQNLSLPKPTPEPPRQKETPPVIRKKRRDGFLPFE